MLMCPGVGHINQALYIECFVIIYMTHFRHLILGWAVVER